MGKPTLKQIEGEGEITTLDIYAHVQAKGGISQWSGMDRDGTPVWTDHQEGGSAPQFIKGQEAAKVAAGKVEDRKRGL